jgi:transcription elongation factor S-II
MSKACEEEVARIKKRLEKMIKENEVNPKLSIDMLNVLKTSSINLQILQNTRIGVVVNNLRKSCNNEELGSLAKNLLKAWKKLVSGDDTKQQSANGSPNSTYDHDNSNQTPTSPPQNLQAQTSQVATPSSESSTSSAFNFSNTNNLNTSKPQSSQSKLQQSSPIKQQQTRYQQPLTITYSDTKDQIRIKSRELLAAALQLPVPIENARLLDPNAVAARCEDAIFNEFKNTDSKYKNRIRSRIANLKDSRNPQLRQNVILGHISPDRLAIMSAEEMASDEMKKLREKYTKESIDDHQMATMTASSSSSLLKCRKCKSTKCGYNELQTRSSDEPMTVFAYCLDCGNRWKM